MIMVTPGDHYLVRPDKLMLERFKDQKTTKTFLTKISSTYFSYIIPANKTELEGFQIKYATGWT